MTEKLFVYGPLGIICAILIVAVVYMYRALDAERKARDEQAAKHQQDMLVFQERYITKAETWMKQYYDQADAHDETLRATKELFDQVMKMQQQGASPQLPPRRTGGGGG